MKRTFSKIINKYCFYILAFIFFLFIPFETILGAADWTSLPSISTSDGSSYYKLTDIATYGSNITNDATYDLYYNDIWTSSSSRVTYEKKIQVTKGTELNLIGALNDTGAGGSHTSNLGRFYWGVIEFDASGNFLWDGGWISTNESWIVGVSSNGTNYGNSSQNRDSVSYVIILFRYATGDMTLGSPSPDVTPAQLANDLPNLYLCYKPFTYTVDYGIGSCNGVNNTSFFRTGVSSCSISKPIIPYGYNFLGYKITSSSTLQPNWMHENIYATETINTWLSNGYFYNSLFGNVTFTAMYNPWQHTISYHANGGTNAPASQIKTYGSILTLSSTVPTRTGYSFLGWNTSADGNGTFYGTGYAYGHDQDGGTIPLYAQWKQNNYKITYHANGGSTSAQDGVYHYGDAVNLQPIASKNGYTFVGWATSPDAKMVLHSLSMPDLATSSNPSYSSDWELTLYAIYTIDVSDVANHTYPAYNKVFADELYLKVWKDNTSYKRFDLGFLGNINTMTYAYKLNSTTVSDYVGDSPFAYEIIAFDNAGNESILLRGGSNVPAPVIPKKYLQTVNHYRYDTNQKEWIFFDTTSQRIEEGTRFTPSYITPPTGYQTDHIDNAYTVSGTKTSNAYYIPKTFTLFFDANGGSVTPSSKNIQYQDRYGYMPTPTKRGYAFTGWYTSKTNDVEITDKSIYSTNGNSTIYAHWSPNSYHVTYDYKTNGGTSSSKITDSVIYGSNLDLSVTAFKNGWTFIGWNTKPDATTGLSSLKMSDADIVLYAIYKKDLTATFIDNTNAHTTSITKTIYNRETSSTITLPAITTITGWNSLGWSLNTEGDAFLHASPNSSYILSDNITFYACYEQDITLSYNTNGSAQILEPETKERFYNASGTYKNPVFTIANAPILDRHSFVHWEELDENGIVLNKHHAAKEFPIDHSMTLTAKWDAHPEIEAYDRYFTLEDAINGDISVNRLLEKVTAIDKEDGTLVNGTDVLVNNYNPDDFKNLSDSTDLSITYQAIDSFGNIVEKTITVHVINTTVTLSPKRYYARFIRSDFYTLNNLPISNDMGGLESTSIWRTNKTYQRLLEHVLNSKAPINTFSFSKDELSQLH